MPRSTLVSMRFVLVLAIMAGCGGSNLGSDGAAGEAAAEAGGGAAGTGGGGAGAGGAGGGAAGTGGGGAGAGGAGGGTAGAGGGGDAGAGGTGGGMAGTGGGGGAGGAGGAPLTTCPTTTRPTMGMVCVGSFTCNYTDTVRCNVACASTYQCISGRIMFLGSSDACFQVTCSPDAGTDASTP